MLLFVYLYLLVFAYLWGKSRNPTITVPAPPTYKFKYEINKNDNDTYFDTPLEAFLDADIPHLKHVDAGQLIYPDRKYQVQYIQELKPEIINKLRAYGGLMLSKLDKTTGDYVYDPIRYLQSHGVVMFTYDKQSINTVTNGRMQY